MKVSGAWWYLLAIERQEACWRSACSLEQQNCQIGFFDCRGPNDTSRVNWLGTTNVTNLCIPSLASTFYQYGIFGDAVNSNFIASGFFSKYFYCLWWGLRNLKYRIGLDINYKVAKFKLLFVQFTYQKLVSSSTGQNLSTSTYIGEVIFTIFVATLGLFLFALLIGNMQVSPRDDLSKPFIITTSNY